MDRNPDRHAHLLSRVLPADQRVVVVPATTPVAEALEKMDDAGYSQIPVTSRREPPCFFSYKSYARAVMGQRRAAARGMPVSACTEAAVLLSPLDDVGRATEALRNQDALLVGTQEKILGVLTPTDLATYLERIGRPYRLLEEAELTVRAIVSHRMNPDEIRCALQAQHEKRPVRESGRRIPANLEEAPLPAATALIVDVGRWPSFEEILGGSRDFARAEFEKLAEIRNHCLHFKGVGAKTSEHFQRIDRLARIRNWLEMGWRQYSPKSLLSSGAAP